MAYQPKSYRKFVATAATAAMVASAVTPAYAASFTDVNDRYKEAVDYLVGKGIANGLTETKFGVSEKIKRVDAAVMIAKALGLDGKNAPDAGFKDVPARAKEAVNALKAAGIINGKSATTFGANDTLTRGEMAIIVKNAYQLNGDGTELKFTDVNDRYAEAVKALVKNEITSGKSATSFGTADPITRGEFAIFLYKADTLTVAPEVVSVNAVADNKVVVTFNTTIEKVDHTNFSINQGMYIGKVELNSDKKSVTLTLTSDLVDGTTYEVTAKDIVSTRGLKLESGKASFTYKLAKISDVTLSTTKFAKGENILDYLVVKDGNGHTVETEAYKVTNVYSTNTSVIETDGDVVGEPGEVAKVTIEVEYKDGTKHKSAEYTVSVKTPAGTGEIAGFYLEKAGVVDADSNYLTHATTDVYDNAAAYKLDASLGKKFKTTLYVGEAYNLHVFNDDTDGNPLTAELDLVGGGYTITSTNATVATVTRGAGAVYVSGHNAGSTDIVITKGSFTKTIRIEVKEAPKFQDVHVGATSVKLSDESQLGTSKVQKGVNQEVVKLGWKDQYENVTSLGSGVNATDSDNDGKIEISNPFGFSASEKLVISVDKLKDGTYPVKLEVVNGELVLTAEKDKDISSFDVKVTYHKADGSTIQKKVAVTYKNVDATKKAVSYEIIPSTKDLNANAAKSYESDTDKVTFTAYALDANGNRVADVSNYVDLTVSGSYAKWLNVEDAVNSNSSATKSSGVASVAFKADAYKYLNEAGSLAVGVAIDYNGLNATQENSTYATETITFTNTFGAPKTVTVDTNPVLVDLSKVSALNVKDLVFGKINANEFVKDGSSLIAVLKGADGYSVEPNVTVKDKDGKVVPFGALQYGLNATTPSAAGYGPVFVSGQELKFSGKITNANNVSYNGAGVTTPITVTSDDLASALDITSGYKGTFTLVIDKVYMAGETTVTGASSEQNLLSAPVQIQVTLVK
jgi:S-layer homology domain